MSLEVRNIRKTFGRFQALEGVNLRVEDGELVALLGPSGCGKTTLLRIIAGLETPDDAWNSAVLFHGQDVGRHSAGERRVGFVFQHYALFRNMSVFENIAFGLRVRPRKQRPSESEIRRRVSELLELIQLEGLARRYPTELSGGQRQRVALARALAIEPRVLLLDEPFGALDAKVRQGLRRWLRRLHDELHVISILVTHDQEEALEVADRVVVMNHGRIEQAGTPEALFHQPASEFVFEFLGSVNLFQGRIEAGRAVFGPLSLAPPGAEAPDGSRARLLVRPHNVAVHRERNGHGALRARVRRIQLAGPQARIEALCETGDTAIIELPHERVAELGARVDEEIYVTLREARVFVDDARTQRRAS
jgi:sulfate transport system ATP-binding protein